MNIGNVAATNQALAVRRRLETLSHEELLDRCVEYYEEAAWERGRAEEEGVRAREALDDATDLQEEVWRLEREVERLENEVERLKRESAAP